MQATKHKVVTIDYRLTGDDGQLIDASGGEPFAYMHGRGNIVIGLERALEGKSAGDRVEVKVSAADGYGEFEQELIRTVPRDAFEDADRIQPGMRFQAETDDGMRVFTVTAVGEEGITVDGNHPLAGQALNFEVTITSIRNPTAEELEHGHVHGEGGHHH